MAGTIADVQVGHGVSLTVLNGTATEIMPRKPRAAREGGEGER